MDEFKRDLKSKRVKGNILWRKVTEEMEREGFNLGIDPAKKFQDKWLNLIKKCNEWVDNTRNTGAPPMEKSVWHDPIEEIVGDKHSVNSVTVFDTTKKIDFELATKKFAWTSTITVSEEANEKSATPERMLLPGIFGAGKNRQMEEEKWKEETRAYRENIIKILEEEGSKREAPSSKFFGFMDRLVTVEENEEK